MKPGLTQLATMGSTERRERPHLQEVEDGGVTRAECMQCLSKAGEVTASGAAKEMVVSLGLGVCNCISVVTG
jgi:hypothetical protein